MVYIQDIQGVRCRGGAPRALAPRPGRSGGGCRGRARATPFGGERGTGRGTGGGGWRHGTQVAHAVSAAACLSGPGEGVLAGPAGRGRLPPVPPRAGLRALWTAGRSREARVSTGLGTGRGASGVRPLAAGAAGPCRRWEAREAGGGQWSSSGRGLRCVRVCSPRRCLGGAHGCVFGALAGGGEAGRQRGRARTPAPVSGRCRSTLQRPRAGEQLPLGGSAGSR